MVGAGKGGCQGGWEEGGGRGPRRGAVLVEGVWCKGGGYVTVGLGGGLLPDRW